MREQIFGWLSMVAIAALACSSPSADADGRIAVVATTTMLGDAATRIGGDLVHVTTLCGPGVDPHLYKASEGDVRRISDAGIIFYTGLHLEAKLADVLHALSSRIPTFALAEAIPAEERIAVAGATGSFDPHVWFDVALWKQVVTAMADAFATTDPVHADAYRARAAAFLEELTALDEHVRTQIARIPKSRRVLVTAHDAFGYFGRAYGIEVHALQGVSTESQAGTADVQRLADFIAERRIPALFVESSVPPRAIEAVQAAVRSRGFEVTIGEELFSDAMGTPGTPGGTYPGMVKHNVAAIVSALVPAGGTHAE